MRRMVMTTLVLLPALASAYAGTSNSTQLSATSANYLAELSVPAAPGTSASITAANTGTHAAIHQLVSTHVIDSFTDEALRQAGTLKYAMFGSIPTQSSAPRLTHAVEVDLTPEELSSQPHVSNVVVHATIDEFGTPRNLVVTKSAGTVFDRKALDAVSQYHFQPATLNNRAVEASVSITISIQKP